MLLVLFVLGSLLPFFVVAFLIFGKQLHKGFIADVKGQTFSGQLPLLSGRGFHAAQGGCRFNHEGIKTRENGTHAPHGIPRFGVKVGLLLLLLLVFVVEEEVKEDERRQSRQNKRRTKPNQTNKTKKERTIDRHNRRLG